MRALTLILALALAGCGTAGKPRVEIQTVHDVVTVHCKPELGPEPAYPDTDAALKAAPNLFARVQLLLAGRVMRMARDGEKTAALKGCEG